MRHKIGDKITINKKIVKRYAGETPNGFSLKICVCVPIKKQEVYITGKKTLKDTETKKIQSIHGKWLKNIFVGSTRVLEVKTSIGRRPFYVPVENYFEEF